jgi:hypothetical protein
LFVINDIILCIRLFYEKTFKIVLKFSKTIKNSLVLIAFILLSTYPEDVIINVETCPHNDEFKLILRTCVVIDCGVIANNSMDYNGAQLKINIWNANINLMNFGLQWLNS